MPKKSKEQTFTACEMIVLMALQKHAKHNKLMWPATHYRLIPEINMSISQTTYNTTLRQLRKKGIIRVENTSGNESLTKITNKNIYLLQNPIPAPADKLPPNKMTISGIVKRGRNFLDSLSKLPPADRKAVLEMLAKETDPETPPGAP